MSIEIRRLVINIDLSHDKYSVSDANKVQVDNSKNSLANIDNFKADVIRICRIMIAEMICQDKER